VHTRCPRFIALFPQIDRLIEKNFVTKRALQTASNFGYDTLMENCCNSSHDNTNNTKKITERKRERKRYVCFYDVFEILFYKLTLKYSRDTIEEQSQVKKSK